MKLPRARTLWAASLALWSLVPGCLPRDTRPVPGSLFVTATGGAPLLGGHAAALTADGWSVSYDRFLITLGGASLGGDSCASYYDADYSRILDMQTKGPQKVGLVYALGPCDFGFRVSGPNALALLGQGVTDADKAFMGAPGTDPYVKNRGISLHVEGHATKGTISKTFSWEFRQRVSYRKCSPMSAGTPSPDLASSDAGDAGGPPSFDLASGEAATVDLAIKGEALFLDSLDETRAALRFDTFARADDEYGNGDGEVTLAELGLVPIGDVTTGGSPGEASDAGTVEAGIADTGAPPANTSESGPLDASTLDGGPRGWKTFEDFVYLGLFPKVASLSGGTCSSRVGGFFR